MKKQIPLFLTGVLLILACLEIVFRLLPVSTATRTGYHIHPQILTYPPHHCFTVSTGWDLKNAQRHCANNQGFLSRNDFSPDREAIALIGDSFVEANMLPAAERLETQLENRLAGRKVYSMGGPGSSLLDYAQRAEYAAGQFGLKTFIFILERGDIKQVLCGSGNIHGPCLDAKSLEARIELQPQPGQLKQFARESALAQYVFSQLRFDIAKTLSRLQRSGKTSTSSLPADLPGATSEKIVATFLERIKRIPDARFIFLIDADRASINAGKVPKPGPDLEAFKAAIQSVGAVVIEPDAAFRDAVTRTGRALEVGPYDRHWNIQAMAIVADELATALNRR